MYCNLQIGHLFSSFLNLDSRTLVYASSLSVACSSDATETSEKEMLLYIIITEQDAIGIVKFDLYFIQ